MERVADEQLVARYLAHEDEQALQSLVERYMSSVYGFVRHYTAQTGMTADITQEVFVKAWKHLKTFDHSKSFKAWLFTIAKNTAIDWLKKQNAVPFSMLDTDEREESFADRIIDGSISAFEAVLLKQQVAPVMQALKQLPSGHDTIIQLHAQQGLTFQEIAEQLNKPLNTVKSQYRRGIHKLKELMR